MSKGHAIINPFGQRIFISQRALANLDAKGYLQKDPATGEKRMLERQAPHFLQIEAGTEWMREIGHDFSGPQYVICGCASCLGKETREGGPEGNGLET